MQKNKIAKRARRVARVRARVRSSSLPRLSVFRSNRYVWLQVIDDAMGQTMASASSKAYASGTKSEKAYETGKTVAKAALAKKIQKVVLDRGAYRYHGIVEAVAKGAREGGLKL